MARRKRASMREGPLADLFRSTVDPDDPPEAPSRPDREADDETGVMSEQPAPAPREPDPEPERAPQLEADEQAPFDQAEPEPERPAEQVRAYRAEEPARGQGTSLPNLRRRRPRRSTGRRTAARSPATAATTATPSRTPPVIRVVGVGGAGVNAINRMVDAGIPGVEFMAVNTDLQSLQQSNADVTVHLGSGDAARPRRRLQPRARLPRRVRGAGQDQAPAEGLRHGLRHLRRRRRHRAPARRR